MKKVKHTTIKTKFIVEKEDANKILSIAAQIMAGYGKHGGKPTDFGFNFQFSDHCLDLAQSLYIAHYKRYYSGYYGTSGKYDQELDLERDK